ncbi:MAG TPA: peroxiredoxin [Rheinheimera sp.]|uniref:peroxiredoxin n=2 Tax=Rheinheimera sp. TaxID=1869214 RepID=UPI000EDE0D9A|nr:peroxiredoxin [Rheinheimera sp.]HCU64437.1 peroxiredoxin [Rheinheimera sp.]
MIKVGDKLPEVSFQRLTDNGVVTLTTKEVFSGETVVLFALPGAFTPTCSAAHLPGFVELAEQFFQAGVDRIICTAVNDAYVLDAWGKQQNAGDILFLADGAGRFATACGLATDSGDFGGLRSLRYAMIVEDGVVQLLNVDAPKTFELTKAEVLLEAVKQRSAS